MYCQCCALGSGCDACSHLAPCPHALARTGCCSTVISYVRTLPSAVVREMELLVSLSTGMMVGRSIAEGVSSEDYEDGIQSGQWISVCTAWSVANTLCACATMAVTARWLMVGVRGRKDARARTSPVCWRAASPKRLEFGWIAAHGEGTAQCRKGLTHNRRSREWRFQEGNVVRRIVRKEAALAEVRKARTGAWYRVTGREAQVAVSGSGQGRRASVASDRAWVVKLNC